LIRKSVVEAACVGEKKMRPGVDILRVLTALRLSVVPSLCHEMPVAASYKEMMQRYAVACELDEMLL
jgi:hypothetical protein